MCCCDGEVGAGVVACELWLHHLSCCAVARRVLDRADQLQLPSSLPLVVPGSCVHMAPDATCGMCFTKRTMGVQLMQAEGAFVCN